MNDQAPQGPTEDPLGSALEAVTGDMARRFSVRVDRLMAQVADLTELDRQIEELERLEAEIAPAEKPEA